MDKQIVFISMAEKRIEKTKQSIKIHKSLIISYVFFCLLLFFNFSLYFLGMNESYGVGLIVSGICFLCLFLILTALSFKK